jgi:hypothetical protein
VKGGGTEGKQQLHSYSSLIGLAPPPKLCNEERVVWIVRVLGGLTRRPLFLGRRTEMVVFPPPTTHCLSSNSVSLLFTVQSPRGQRCQVRLTWTLRRTRPSALAWTNPLLSSHLAPPAPILQALTPLFP